MVKHIGITTNDDYVELDASNVRFIFQYASVQIFPIWDANKYEIRYKPSTKNTFYQDAGYNFYLPEDQIYYHSDIFTGGTPRLVLKPLYIEYKGFRSIGWTKQDGINVLVRIPDDFMTDDRLDVKPAIDLYIAWEKIEYKILNNTFNHEAIYSTVTRTSGKEFFYTFSKRLNHSVEFTTNKGRTFSYEGTTGLVIDDILYNSITYKDDGNEISLDDAYDFFYEDGSLLVKSLRSLQNEYKKSSLIELTEVIVWKHYPIEVKKSNGDKLNETSIVDTYDLYYKFTDVNTVETFVITQKCICEILLVGGGGAGGNGDSSKCGGGGGAGTVTHIPLISLDAGTYNISVGKGGSSSGSSTSSTISLDGLIITEAKGGGRGGDDSDTNGKDGGSGGGGASADSLDSPSYGGNGGDDPSSSQHDRYLYQNYGHTNDVTNAGGGGGGAGFYSVNKHGGNGIQINIDNNNYYYGGGGGGGEDEDGGGGYGGDGGGGNGGNGGGGNGGNGVDGYGGGGGGGGLSQDGGNGGNGLVIIKIKEGYNINHLDNDSFFEKGLLLTNQIGNPSTSSYDSGETIIVQTVEFQGNVQGKIKSSKYYGYFKALQERNYVFKIDIGDSISKCIFNLGFGINKISFDNSARGIYYEQIYLEPGVFYPMYIEFMSNDSTASVEIQYAIEETTIDNFDPIFQFDIGLNWNDMNNPDGANSPFLFHLKTFNGTTSMRTLKVV